MTEEFCLEYRGREMFLSELPIICNKITPDLKGEIISKCKYLTQVCSTERPGAPDMANTLSFLLPFSQNHVQCQTACIWGEIWQILARVLTSNIAVSENFLD